MRTTIGVDPSSVVESIRTTIAALDPDLPLRELLPADRQDRLRHSNFA